jgi:hypothetical protein
MVALNNGPAPWRHPRRATVPLARTPKISGCVTQSFAQSTVLFERRPHIYAPGLSLLLLCRFCCASRASEVLSERTLPQPSRLRRGVHGLPAPKNVGILPYLDPLTSINSTRNMLWRCSRKQIVARQAPAAIPLALDWSFSSKKDWAKRVHLLPSSLFATLRHAHPLRPPVQPRHRHRGITKLRSSRCAIVLFVCERRGWNITV